MCSRDESTENLHLDPKNLSIFLQLLHGNSSTLDNEERVCERKRSPTEEKKSFQMVHGAWRDSMTALFKILWRMKHTV
jgi:hypothetical protein